MSFGSCSGRTSPLFWDPLGSRDDPHEPGGRSMAKILSNVRSDKLSLVFLVVVLATTFLF